MKVAALSKLGSRVGAYYPININHTHHSTDVLWETQTGYCHVFSVLVIMWGFDYKEPICH